MSGIFGGAPVIFAYTRAEAIADGVLIDVSQMAAQAGLRYPVAITDHAWAELVAWSDENPAIQDETGRLWDVLMATRAAIAHSSSSTDRVTVAVLRVPNSPTATTPVIAQFIAHCGPGDEGEPVITLMLEGDD